MRQGRCPGGSTVAATARDGMMHSDPMRGPDSAACGLGKHGHAGAPAARLRLGGGEEDGMPVTAPCPVGEVGNSVRRQAMLLCKDNVRRGAPK